eukprot:699593-Pleurochrysis_carterae.AAC.3
MTTAYTDLLDAFEALGESALKKQRKIDGLHESIKTTLELLKGDAIMIIDTETSGLGGVVIQLAFRILRRDDMSSLCEYNRYWKLPLGHYIDARAKKIHKITEAFLATNAHEAEAELSFVHQIFWDRKKREPKDKFLLVAHNLQFDVGRLVHSAIAHQLVDVCHASIFAEPKICTMAASQMPCKNKLGRPKKPKNEEQYTYFFGVPPECTLHDALSDVS